MKHFVKRPTILWGIIIILLSSCTEKYSPDGALYHAFLEEKHEPYWDINVRALWRPRQMQTKYHVCMYFDGERYTGKVIQLYANGYAKFKGQYLEGKRHGKWTFYYDDGQAQKILEYQKNRLRSKKEFEREQYDDEF